MTEVISKEKNYRNLSILLLGVFAVFWIAMITSLLIIKIIPDYRRANTVDYSLLFRENSITNFTTMKIYVDGKYKGQTRTIINETEGGGRTIKGETIFSVDNPYISGMLKINSTINISPEKELKDLNISFLIPLKEQIQQFSITGVKQGDKLIIEIPVFGVHEEVEIGDEVLTSGISPFSEVKLLEVGKQWPVGMIDPLSRTVKKLNIKVVSEETITWLERKEKVYKLESRDQGGGLVATAWVDSYGRTLKEVVSFMGMTLELKQND